MTRGIADRLPRLRVLRRLAKPAIGRAGWLWRVIRSPSLRYLTFGHPIDCILYALAISRPRIFLIQIGANDAGPTDTLHPFLQWANWSGILVEPAADTFQRLSAAYEQFERFTLENVAIAAETGPGTLYRIAQPAGAKAEYSQLASLHPEIVRANADVIPEMAGPIESEQVDCLTFADLCERHQVDRIDLIVIDAEGHDYEVLKQIDFPGHRPSVVIHEHIHLRPPDRAAARELLIRHGYRLAELERDTVAVRNDRLASNPMAAGWRCILNAEALKS